MNTPKRLVWTTIDLMDNDAHEDRHACSGCAAQGASPQVLPPEICSVEGAIGRDVGQRKKEYGFGEDH